MRDRTVLVTGGTGALGGAVVDVFLDAGWRVVCTWVVPQERERMGERDGVELIEADLFHEEQVTAAVRQAAATDGAPLRAVANLVGGYLAGPRVDETTLEEFEGQLRLNLRPTFLVTRAALPRLVEAGGGSIVCMSARAASVPSRAPPPTPRPRRRWRVSRSASRSSTATRASAAMRSCRA